MLTAEGRGLLTSFSHGVYCTVPKWSRQGGGAGEAGQRGEEGKPLARQSDTVVSFLFMIA